MNVYLIKVSDRFTTKTYYQQAGQAHVAVSRVLEYAKRQDKLTVNHCDISVNLVGKNKTWAQYKAEQGWK